MWFAKFTCASHLAASVEGCWIGMLAFLQILALSSGPQGHSFSHFITIAVDVAFQTSWSARAHARRLWFANSYSYRWKDVLAAQSSAAFASPCFFAHFSQQMLCARRCIWNLGWAKLSEPAALSGCLQRMSWGFGCGKWRWEATPLGQIVTASSMLSLG